MKRSTRLISARSAVAVTAGILGLSSAFVACKPQENKTKSVDAIVNGGMDKRAIQSCGDPAEKNAVTRVYDAAPDLLKKAIPQDSVKLVSKDELSAIVQCVADTWKNSEKNKITLSDDEIKGLTAIWYSQDILPQVQESLKASGKVDCKALADQTKGKEANPTIYIRNDNPAFIDQNLIAMLGYAVFETADKLDETLASTSGASALTADDSSAVIGDNGSADSSKAKDDSSSDKSKLDSFEQARDEFAQQALEDLKKLPDFAKLEETYRAKYSIAKDADLLSSTALKDMFLAESIDSVYCAEPSARELQARLSSAYTSLMHLALNNAAGFTKPWWFDKAVATKQEPAQKQDQAAQQPSANDKAAK